MAKLDARVATLTRQEKRNGFPPAFFSSPAIDPDHLGVNDVLEIVVWETAAEGVLGAGGGPARLGPIRVDGDGRVFVPFVGPLRAAGLELDAFRERVRAALESVTLSPQVDVRLLEPRSRMITIQGAVQRPGSLVLDSGATHLAPLLAFAGGATIPAEQTEVVIRRGDAHGAETLADIYANPSLDVAIRPGDAIFLNPIRERFTVLGATAVQGQLPFPMRPLSLLAAIGAARGLDDFSADPTGVFVFRREDPRVADRLLSDAPPEGLPAGEGRPIIYRLDLTEPGALFVASAFEMRDGDAIFATNAPLTELRKLVSLFQATVVPVQSIGQLQNIAGP